MIYLESEKSNVLFVIDYPDFQSYYDACLENWDLRFISCSNCEGNTLMRKNGFYRRRIETKRGTESVRIQRMRCPCCGHSDALFPADIVPYSPIMAEEHVAIIEIYLESFHAESFFHRISVITEACEEVLSLSSLPDFPTIYKLVKRYEAVWAAYAVHLHPLFDSLPSLMKFCIQNEKRHFQQARGKARFIHTGMLARAFPLE